MSKITKKQLALVHVAKSKLNLSEEDYREILSQFNVKSSKDLTRLQFRELINIFKELGFDAPDFQPWIPKYRPSIERLQALGEAEQRIEAKLTGQKATGSPHTPLTDKQKRAIWAIWNNVSRAPEEKREDALNTLCKKICGIDCWEWLSVKKAQHFIFILEKMQNG